jgi:hypothetical protein
MLKKRRIPLLAQNGWFIELDSELALPSQIAFEIKGFNRKCKQIIDGILLFKS